MKKLNVIHKFDGVEEQVEIRICEKGEVKFFMYYGGQNYKILTPEKFKQYYEIL